MSNSKSSHYDIQQEVTNQIIDLLETVDMNDYQPPFAGLATQGIPYNPTTNLHYQGVNILNLWMLQQRKAFTSNEWATFKQWQNIDANVRKGEKGSRIIFYKTLIKSEENPKGELEEIKIPMLKTYTVFNANQVEGYQTTTDEIEDKIVSKVKTLKNVDEYCLNTKAKITHHESGRAYYNIVSDSITMPDQSLFKDTKQADATENYYSTLLHELTHWTGAKHRLNRNFTALPSKEDYAFEELVAELGSAFLCAQHEITQTQPDHHALYIKSWLKALKDNKTYIFKASAQASKAILYLNDLQPK